MRISRTIAVVTGTVLALTGLAAVPAGAVPSAATSRGAVTGTAATARVSLSRPLLPVRAGARPGVDARSGIPLQYTGNWSGYVARPKAAGDTFTGVTGSYTVPSVSCAGTPNSFSYHWIGLDGFSSQTVEQVGVAADCDGTTPSYVAWFEMYPAPFSFAFTVHPGDSIASAVAYHGHGSYELILTDVSSGRGFDLVRACPVARCENSSAEAVTEAYYYSRRYAGTSNFGDERYGPVTVVDSAGMTGGLADPRAWNTTECIALGVTGAVDTAPGPLSGGDRPTPSSSFAVYWGRQN